MSVCAPSVPHDLIRLAHELADCAGDIARRYFRTAHDVDTKPDQTPVTQADRLIEKTLREILEDARPDDGIIGEEFGVRESRSGLVWVIDPIDGTKAFMTGRPSFGTLIALWEGEETPLLGTIDQPILRERWMGVRGETTSLNGRPACVRSCPDFLRAQMATTSPSMFVGADLARFESLKARARFVVYGGDCYAYGQLAAGWLDLVIEAKLGVHDYAALVPVITGAGGRITNWEGQPLTLRGDGRVLAVGDPALLPQALALLTV